MSLTLTDAGEHPAPARPEGSLAAALARAAADPTVDPQRMRELYAIHREIVADEAKMQFNQALAAAQSEVPRVAKNGTIKLIKDGVDKGSIAFATWADVDTAIRPIMAKHGFSVTFSEVARDANGIRWSATYRHQAGHAESNFITLPPDTGAGRNPLQAAGSTASYAKRYLVEDFFNIIRDGADDDGKVGGTVRITGDQRDELLKLIEETQTNEGRFLDVMGTEARSIEEVEAKDFARMKNALLVKKNKRAVAQ